MPSYIAYHVAGQYRLCQTYLWCCQRESCNIQHSHTRKKTKLYDGKLPRCSACPIPFKLPSVRKIIISDQPSTIGNARTFSILCNHCQHDPRQSLFWAVLTVSCFSLRFSVEPKLSSRLDFRVQMRRLWSEDDGVDTEAREAYPNCAGTYTQKYVANSWLSGKSQIRLTTLEQSQQQKQHTVTIPDLQVYIENQLLFFFSVAVGAHLK